MHPDRQPKRTRASTLDTAVYAGRLDLNKSNMRHVPRSTPRKTFAHKLKSATYINQINQRAFRRSNTSVDRRILQLTGRNASCGAKGDHSHRDSEEPSHRCVCSGTSEKPGGGEEQRGQNREAVSLLHCVFGGHPSITRTFWEAS